MLIDNFERIRTSSKMNLKNQIKVTEKNLSTKLELSKSKTLKYKNNDIGYNELSLESHIDIMFKDIQYKIIKSTVSSSSSNLCNIIYSNINYNKFGNCTFNSIKFKHCTFISSLFENCTFKNVVFEDCDFGSIDLSIFKNYTKFIDCTFINCNLAKNIFDNAEFYNTKFILSNLKGCIFNDCVIREIYISDCDCRYLKILSSIINFIEFDDNFLTKLNEFTFFDKLITDNNKQTYENSERVYKAIYSKFEDNRVLTNAGEYYYLFKLMEFKNLKGLNKIKSKLFYILCGYGERPIYALLTSIEIIMIFSIIYMFTGFNVGGKVINYKINFILNLPIENLITDFIKSIYFSIVTFTTVGYGDITPTGFSLILSGIEMFIGVTLVGVWTATLARKITR